jgi:hypothetical protein
VSEQPPDLRVKRCGACGRELPASAFHRRTASRDGLQAHCVACAAEYASAWRVSKRGVSEAERREGQLEQEIAYRGAVRERLARRYLPPTADALGGVPSCPQACSHEA